MLSTLKDLPSAIQATLNDPHMLHGAVVHMPVALAILGPPIVLAALVFNKRSAYLRATGVVCYLLLAATAYIAVRTGETASGLLPNTLPEEIWAGVTRHEETAEKVAWFALVTAGLIGLSFVPVRPLRLSALALATVSCAATLAWVVETGHQGGALLYQEGLGAPALVIETHKYSRELSSEEASAEGFQIASLTPEMLALPQQIRFSEHVDPIFRSYCLACHNSQDAEGGLDLSAPGGVYEGGEKLGPAVVPGDPATSPIIRFARGELHPRMPKDELPLAERDIRILEQWIRDGAHLDDSDSGDRSVTESRTAEAANPKPALQRLIDILIESDPVQLARMSVEDGRDFRYTFLADYRAAPGDAGPADAELNRFHIYERHAMRLLRRELRLRLVEPAPRPPAIDSLENPVDRFIAARLKDDGLVFPAERCSDATFIRRAFLDLLGVVPTTDEVRSFESKRDSEKRTNLIGDLLAQNDAYAANWVPFWEDALCSTQGSIPREENVDRILDERGDYAEWIYDAFAANTPYDLWVTELLDPAMPSHPERYVLRTDRMDVVLSAANTAQVFMGASMKCASCHNHFSNPEWPQNRFLGFAGFFTDRDLELVRCDRFTDTYVPTSFIFDLPEIDITGPEGMDARISRLAELMVDPTNPRFATTLVNRIWKRLLGEGLSEPVDDYREDRPPSHPELLEWLAHDFISNGYDIKQTLRLIMSSRTYQLPHNPALVETFDVGRADAPRYFRSPHLRRLTAEQVVDSIHRALGTEWEGEARLYTHDDVTPFRKALGRTTTRNEVMTSRPDDLAVVQALEFLNSPEYHEYIYQSPRVQGLAPVLAGEGPTASLIEDIYLCVLSRPPSQAEMQAASEYLQDALGTQEKREVKNIPPRVIERAAQALGDVFWVLFTSAEFQYIT